MFAIEVLSSGVNNEVMFQFLEMITRSVEDHLEIAPSDAVIIMDNVKPHVSKQAQQLFKSKRMLCITCPSYHPELNLVEMIFRFVKSHFRPIHLKNK